MGGGGRGGGGWRRKGVEKVGFGEGRSRKGGLEKEGGVDKEGVNRRERGRKGVGGSKEGGDRTILQTEDNKGTRSC